MAEVPYTLRFTQHLCPRHFSQMVLERHRVGDEFQPFIQTAVCLDVEIFSVLVRDVEQLLRVAVYCAAVIDFELNTKVPQALAMKHKIRRVAVFVNDIVVLIPARRTVGIVVIVPIGAIAMNNAATVLAADVILIKAMLTQSVRIVLNSVLLVDPLGAVVADYGQAIRAVLAESIAFHFKHLVNWMLSTAICTNSCFAHCLFLHFV